MKVCGVACRSPASTAGRVVCHAQAPYPTKPYVSSFPISRGTTRFVAREVAQRSANVRTVLRDRNRRGGHN